MCPSGATCVTAFLPDSVIVEAIILLVIAVVVIKVALFLVKSIPGL